MPFNPRKVLIGAAVALVAIQVIPVPRTNPASDPSKAFSATRPAGDPAVAVLRRSCSDCHSNDTRWPWYSRVAPVSWLLYRDVSSGRRHLNLSEFGTYDQTRQERRVRDICEQVKDGEMPPWFYLPMHPDAKLQPGDVQTLCGLSQPTAGN